MSVPLRARLLIADDHALVRRGLRLIIDGAPDLHVVAEVGDGLEAIERAVRGDIDLAILDVAMPRCTGLQAARELAARLRRSRRGDRRQGAAHRPVHRPAGVGDVVRPPARAGMARPAVAGARGAADAR
jgi:CheY-like chemotaxis protein